jgi:hypothetical protein
LEYQVDGILTILKELKGAVSKPISTKLDLDKCERVVERLGSFSTSCEECQQHLLELKDHVLQLKANSNQLEDNEIKQYRKMIGHIISHLQSKHKLVTAGYYLAIYMSLGMSLGVTFGLTIFDNIGLGIPLGMCIGLAIGAGLDADSKKKGKTI